MSSRRLAKRIVVVLGVLALYLAVLVVAEAQGNATPIRPDVRQLVQPQGPPAKFEPARAGWKGPETSVATGLPLDLTREAHVRAVRHALLAVLTPDPKALAAIVVLIVLLRKLREQKGRQERPGPPVEAPDVELPQAA